MVENSPAGLVMLEAGASVTVTREEDHQPVLARYPVGHWEQRQVAVELGWCAVRSGKYRGQRAIEVRLDGLRVGELTYLMSERYAPLVTQVTSAGGRPGCEAVIQLGAKGLELTLRLPRDVHGAVPGPPAAPVTALAPKQRLFSSHRPVWIAAAIVLIAFVGAIATDEDDPAPSSTSLADSTTPTTTPATTTPTTTTTTPPAPPTTTLPPPPPPPPTTAPPTPKTTTKRPAPPPPPPAEPVSDCDPNYSGCVPVASDVDCEGGSGNGPAYVAGPVQVIGQDVYGLDRDGDGTGCD